MIKTIPSWTKCIPSASHHVKSKFMCGPLCLAFNSDLIHFTINCVHIGLALYHSSFEGKMTIMLGLLNYMKTFVIDYLFVCIFHCFTLVMTNWAQRIKFLSISVFSTTHYASGLYGICPEFKVLTPYSSEDACGLFRAAIRDPGPAFFLENEFL